MKWTLTLALTLLAAPLAAEEARAPLETVGASRPMTALANSMPNEPAGAVRNYRALWADPAIKDFIGLSENAWDFSAPERIPGFGPLTQTEGSR